MLIYLEVYAFLKIIYFLCYVELNKYIELTIVVYQQSPANYV